MTNSVRVRKRFGQHFLVDEDVIDRIFESLAIRATDSVLEIGPGPGTLTQRLLLESVTFTRSKSTATWPPNLRAPTLHSGSSSATC